MEKLCTSCLRMFSPQRWHFSVHPCLVKGCPAVSNPLPFRDCSCLFMSSGVSCTLCVSAKSLPLCPTLHNPMDCTHQAPLSMGFPRQEHWSGLSFPSPGELLNPGIKPASLACPVLAAGYLPLAPPGKPSNSMNPCLDLKHHDDRHHIWVFFVFCFLFLLIVPEN